MDIDREYMTMADAVVNVGVRAKKTILRWAQAEGIREQYGRTETGGATVERVVPVEWVVAKMRARGIQSDPVYDRVTVLEHATFDAGNRSGLPAAPGAPIPREAVEAIERLQSAFQQSLQQIEVLMEDRARSEDELKRTVLRGQEDEQRLHASLKRTNTVGFVALAVGLAALCVGVLFTLRMGVSLHRNQVEQGTALGTQLKQGQEAISLLLASLKAENERLRLDEERRAGELAGLHDALQALNLGLAQRDERITDVLSSRIRRAEELNAELDRIKAEKAQIAEQIKDILASEAARTGK